MKKITILLALFITSFGFSQTELLTNGDFSNSDNSWTLTGGSVVSGEAAFPTTPSGGNPWDAQLVQGSLSFTNAQEYTIVFDARADAARDITLAIQNVGIWSDQFRQNFSITTAMTTYTATFNATSSNSSVQIGFLMAAFGVTDGVYYDNISLTTNAGPTCSDGIMNGNETGVDCGGSDCPACVADAPDPGNPDSEVTLSLFNDVPGYTNAYTAEGEFGARAVIDLDNSAAIDNAIKMDFSNDSWGQYNNTTVDVSAANFLNFQYYAPTMTPGSSGHEFYFMVNSGSGEKFYTFKADVSGDDTIVFDSWQTVSIPMTFFTNQGFDASTFLVWKLGTPSTDFTKVVYFDNIFFGTNVLSDDDFANVQFKVYPNPTRDKWNIENNTIINTINVFDILGKQVMSLTPNANSAQISTSDIKTGVYFARVEGVNGSKTIKLIKQ